MGIKAEMGLIALRNMKSSSLVSSRSGSYKSTGVYIPQNLREGIIFYRHTLISQCTNI